MKHWKSIALGFVAGALAMTATPVLGAAYKSVSALLMSDVMFQVEDKTIASPSDQPVLNYNNYTYVPIRFAAETLGCEVKWDAATRKVVLVPPKQPVKIEYVEKEVEKIVYVDKESTEEGKVYSKLPVKEYRDGYNVTLSSVIMAEDNAGGAKRTRLYFTVENTRLEKLELVPDEAKLVLDGKEYELPVNEGLWDKKWRQEYIKKDKKMEGYLIFDGVNEEYSTGTVEFDIRIMDDNQSKKEHIIMKFKK